MTSKQAKKLKKGDKVIPRYDAFEIRLKGTPTVQTVDHISYDQYTGEYLISFAGSGCRHHKSVDLVETI